MAGASEIADLLVAGMRGPTGPEDAAFHTGVVKSWDKSSGVNVVTVNGVDLPNVKSLQSGVPSWYVAGDVVVVIRKQTQYFIMGKVAAPGAGAGSGPVAANSTFNTVFNTANAWADNPSFPNTPQVTTYIGTSRQALVICSCEIYVRAGDAAFGPDVHNPMAEGGVSYTVSGATTLAAGSFSAQAAYNRIEFYNPGGGQAVQSLITCKVAFLHLSLNSGLTTFTMKYKTQGGTAQFTNPDLTVIPV